MRSSTARLAAVDHRFLAVRVFEAFFAGGDAFGSERFEVVDDVRLRFLGRAFWAVFFGGAAGVLAFLSTLLVFVGLVFFLLEEAVALGASSEAVAAWRSSSVSSRTLIFSLSSSRSLFMDSSASRSSRMTVLGTMVTGVARNVAPGKDVVGAEGWVPPGTPGGFGAI